MGREIRMVPPNWSHPKKWFSGVRGPEERYQPMHDREFDKAAKEWIRDFTKFYDDGGREKHGCEFWEYDGRPPDREYYRSYNMEDATWFQLFETVSEGTPVSPPFETKEELADYLAENGDFWDQLRRAEGKSIIDCLPWGKEAAHRFVFGSGWAPSIIVTGGQIMSGHLAVLSEPGGEK